MSNLPDFGWHDDSGTLYIDDACIINFGGTPPDGSVELVEDAPKQQASPVMAKEQQHGRAHLIFGAELNFKMEGCQTCSEFRNRHQEGYDLGKKHGKEYWAKEFDAARQRNKARYGNIPFPKLSDVIDGYLNAGYNELERTTKLRDLQTENDILRKSNTVLQNKLVELRTAARRMLDGVI
jgi:hypothetical protein